MSEDSTPVEVWTGDGRRRPALVNITETNRVAIIPPGSGAIVLDPVTDAQPFAEAVLRAAEDALRRIREQEPPSPPLSPKRPGR